MSETTKKDVETAGAGGTAAAAAIVNPHNPDFITKRPWYLKNEEDADAATVPTLDHQGAQKIDTRQELTLTEAERVLEQKRQKEKQLLSSGSGGASASFYKGQWVEALKKNKPPYRIAQITKVHSNKNAYDLQFEDGFVERKVKLSGGGGNNNNNKKKPRIRSTKTGNRSMDLQDKMKETFDSKRDQYHGYDRDAHNRKINAKYEEREQIRLEFREKEKEERKKNKKKLLSAGGDGGDTKDDDDDDDNDNDDGNGSDGGASSDSDIDSDMNDDEFVQKDEDAKVLTTRLARQGGVGGAQMKVTARNLRIREDTAKYLRNLDPNSAYYDPKSRSMRDNPHPEQAVETTDFAGDNFARVTGDAVGLAETQLFAWDASDKGVNEIHPQANPSQAELLKKEFQTEEGELKRQRKKAVLDKYGGGEYLDGTDGLASAVVDDKKKDTAGDGNKKPPALDRKLRFGVSTVVEEYSRDGRLLKSGGKEVKYRPLESKYEEDIYINGHITAWGSYFHKGAFQWGYADDHSLMKNSYCTGDNGRLANDEANEMRYGTGKAGSAALAQARGLLKAIPKTTKDGGGGGSVPPPHISRSKLYGEADPAAEIDQDKLKEAVKRAAKQQQQEEEGDDATTGDGNKKKKKKRKYNSLNTDDADNIKEEDMEAYRLLKGRQSDPMANNGGSSDDVLLEYDDQRK